MQPAKWYLAGQFGLCDRCFARSARLDGSIYFIRAGDVAKIGYSRDPARRVRDLAVGSPVPLELWHSMPGLGEDARALHVRFADERLHGEWFRISDRLREFVEGAQA